MKYEYFSRNGKISPIEEAHVPLSNVEYSYGFGVYESIRVSNGVVYFLDEHIERLMSSAQIIGIDHSFAPDMIYHIIGQLLDKNAADTCNVKILLIGGKTAADAELDILCLNPLFPDKKLYRDGIVSTTYPYKRPFPHAKTLNMLRSYLAYRKAKEAGAYDALLTDREGRITEGTRTNFFCIKGRTLFSPREEDILLGVTRKAVLKVATDAGFTVEQKDIRLADLGGYDGAFLTSTSSKILPIRAVDGFRFAEQPGSLKELMTAFDAFLDGCGGRLRL